MKRRGRVREGASAAVVPGDEEDTPVDHYMRGLCLSSEEWKGQTDG